MIKTTLLLLLLTVSTFQQNTLGSSDDASVSSEAITIDFGSVGAAPPTPMRNGRPLEGNIQGYQTTDQRAPVTGPVTDWSFVQTEKSSYTNSGWKFPGNTYQIHPKGYQTAYTITFNTDCPQKSVNFIFTSTGYTFIVLNGQMIKTWLAPYPSYHNVTLSTPHLKCGCNTIKVMVHNYCCPTPAALTYTLSQNSTGCYDCENNGVTFYNRNTCQCECAEECACKSPLRKWYGYPACGCKCRDGPKTCPSGQYWDWASCDCKCRRKCCPSGYKQDPNSCGCVRQFCEAEQCKWPQIWNQNTCHCECSNTQQCTSPQVWNKDSCKCNCPNVQTCPAGQQWDHTSCSCKCQQQQCNWPRVWNPTTCSCQCPSSNSQCTSPRIWNTTTCSCQCQRALCPYPQVWNPSTCQCQCPPCGQICVPCGGPGIAGGNVGTGTGTGSGTGTGAGTGTGTSCVPHNCPWPYTFDYAQCGCFCTNCPSGYPPKFTPPSQGPPPITEGSGNPNTGTPPLPRSPSPSPATPANDNILLDSEITVGN